MPLVRKRSRLRSRPRTDRFRAEAADLATAMTLVSRGDADRVTLVGLRYGERLGPRARARGQELGVRVSLQPEPTGAHSVVIARDDR